MKTSKLTSLLFAMALVSFYSVCAEAADPKAVVIATELKALHKSGVEMQKSFNENNESSFRACVAKSRPLRTRAMALRKKLKTLDAFAGDGAYDDAIDLDMAADQAMSCLYCASSDKHACTKLGATMKKLDARWGARKVP